ncbi:MAG: glycosyltransferase [Actinobacteria bacterium]|nr:glycosyltransferase [Actinomycetota bacterium]
MSMRDVERAAVIVYHSSPLHEPGSGDAGGMTVYVRAVAVALANLGMTTDIFTRATSEIPRVVELYPGVRVIPIEAGPLGPIAKEVQRRHIPEFVAGIRTFAMSEHHSYDVVHSHYWQSGVAAMELARAWDVPHIHSHHTLGRVKNSNLAEGDFPEPQSRLDGEDDVIRKADVLIASTDDEWRQLACLYLADHDKLKTIHPGVDRSLFHPGDQAAARASLGLGDEAVLLYVGRIQKLKGIDLALRAFSELDSALEKDVRFVIVGGASGAGGEGELTRLQDLAAELGIASKVRFEGPQPHENLPTYYQAADAVVVCSHSESFGLAALEAHACGTPVVGTPVGGLSYIVADGASGFLSESRDPTEFAGRLKTLLSDAELRASFGARAAERAARFSWATTAYEFHELYECLVREDLPQPCTC